MNSVLLIALGIFTVVIGLIVFNYRKMKHGPEVKKSDKIILLNKKNFSSQIRQGTVLVDFYAAEYAPCKAMMPVLNDIAESKTDTVKIAKVNVKHQNYLTTKCKIKDLPTMILYKDGKEVKRFVGVKTKRFLLKEIG